VSADSNRAGARNLDRDVMGKIGAASENEYSGFRKRCLTANARE
jgi:hypothetical protein